MQFKLGRIEDLFVKSLSRFKDSRGWLCELFRHDELASQFHPVMSYISMTEPGVARGPHEHRDQADYFCFIGPSNFQLWLWDMRPHSPSYGVKQVEVVGQDNPIAIVVPAGVVHAYKNIGTVQGIVFNCPNRLYRGVGKKEEVDEIRHEDAPGSLFHLD